ncbi:MAG: helix-turn-helix domain-containing protein [Trueperaceae bacterium]|nr:helix-turn-helix domain-containing protein [Trueperaceae bacterium]
MGSARGTEQLSRSRTFGAGDVVLYPGPPGDLYQVVSGLVRLHAVDGDGLGATLRYVKPGGYFGEEAVTGRPRRYFAEAVTAAAVTVLDPHYLSGADVRALALDLAVAIDRLNRSVLRLATRPLKARVAAELLELSDSAIASVSEEGVATVRMTHDELAAAVGSVRETVTKVIGELVRAGALRAGYAKLVILDPDLLTEIADA